MRQRRERPRRLLRRRPGLPVRGPPLLDSSCKDSVKRGARGLSPKGEPATLRWRYRRAQTPADPDRTRSRPAGACLRAGGDDRLARRPAGRAAHALRREPPGPLRPRRHPLARAGNGAVPDALDERSLERVEGRGARGRGSARRGDGRADAEGRLASRQPVVGRAVRPDRVPAGAAGSAACVPGSSRALARACRRERCSSRVRPRSCRAAAGMRTRRSGAPDRRSPLLCESPSSITPPARTATPPRRRRRS